MGSNPVRVTNWNPKARHKAGLFASADSASQKFLWRQ